MRFNRPKSYTGEDIVELHLHGSMAVVKAVFSSLSAMGFSHALPGNTAPNRRSYR